MGPSLPPHLNPCSSLGFWVCKSLRCCCCGARLSCGLRVRKAGFDGMVVNNSMFCHSPDLIEAMETNNEELGKGGNDGIAERNGESCSSSDFLVSAATRNDDRSHSSSDESFSSHSVDWPAKSEDLEGKPQNHGTSVSEAEMMKERFSKLLLGEDMSGSGNGVCPALAISNAITNLCATVFGQVWRLEPLPHEKKLMWRREMQWLLSVSDHVVELIPSSQTFRDGSELEVMTCRPRSDLHAGLPALRKLDNMLLEILGTFDSKEFWYIDQGILAPDADTSSSLRRREEKWWLPVPQVPPGGLPVASRKQLQHKRDSTNQILKAATAINTIALAEMEVPESYLEALPKNGRACLGDPIHRCITSDQFCAQCLLGCLDLSSEHRALEAANRIEAAAHSWRRRNITKPLSSGSRSASRSSWEMVKELMVDTEKWDVLADRAESLLLSLKQLFPGLHQTTLDVSKIQSNKDVGKSILESYSRVLESLAFNMIARIDDLLYVDDVAKHSERVPSDVVSQKKVTAPPYSLHATPSFSPCQLHGNLAANGDRSPLVDSSCSLPPCGPCERG